MVNVQSESDPGFGILYTRVSTQQQVADGMSLQAQERVLRNAATLYGFSKVELVVEEGRSGKSISGRPALKDALNRLNNGSANALFVSRIDRLARSTTDFLSIVDQAAKNNWRLVLLDLNLDTSTYQGRFVVTVMSALAEMERGIIAERQRDVHKHRRATGHTWGVDIGPKPKIPTEIVQRILDERAAGASMGGIAKGLNKEGILTAFGKKWSGASIKYVLDKRSIDKNSDSEDSSLSSESSMDVDETTSTS